MNHHRNISIVTLFGLLTLLAASTRAAEPDATPPDPALAARFSALALQAFDVPKPSSTSLQQCAALLDAAFRSDPTQAHYARLLADVNIQLRNTKGAIDALAAFRKLRPDDQLSQLELIDLYVGQMQTLDLQLNYLADLLSRNSIPPEVRSAIALRCHALLLEKGNQTRALEMLDAAISLNPLNLAALSTKFNASARSANPAQRLSLRLAMLRANPDQADLVLGIANELANLGLTEPAIAWYEKPIYGPQEALQVGPDYIAQLLLMGRIADARDQLAAIIQLAPDHYAARALRIITEKHLEQKDQALLDKLKLETRNLLVNTLADARKQLGAADAATRPVADAALPLPDLASDLERWKNAPTEDAKKTYLQIVGELAWFELFFNNSPANAAPLVEHYARLATPDNLTAARLTGWLYLLQGNRTAEARVKLSAAAADDPLAALGLIRAYGPDQRDQAKQEAAKLLSQNPSGILAALLWDGLYDLAPKVTPGPDAPAVLAALKDFPLPWFDILKQPARFYSMRCEPLKVSYAYGEPMYLRITLTNTSPYDLTIGNDGVLHPGLFIELVIQGPFRNAFKGMTVYDRITQCLVLKPRQSISITLRADRQDLARFLAANPRPPIILSGTLHTNIVSTAQGIASGAAGYAVSFSRPMERAAFAATQDSFRRLKDALAAPDPAEKLRAIDLLATCAAALNQSKDDPQATKQADELLQLLQKSLDDPQPPIRAWAAFQYAAVRTGQTRQNTATRMLKDPAWQARLLGLLAIPWLETLSVDQKKALADGLLADPDPAVRLTADAIGDIVTHPPTTQPTTAPTTTPTTLPTR
jgi:hypothetical protein